MPNLLPIEDDWRHLIEKRSGKDRRKAAGSATQKKAPASVPRRGKDRRKGGSQGK